MLGSAEHSVLIVDPYMDAVTVTDYLPLVRAGVSIRLLTDAHKSALTESTANAVRRFTQQYGDARPISARAAPARSLHDRLILVDGRDVWSLTQSLKDFAGRSPASLLQADSGTATLKLAAYEQVWAAASAL